MKPQKMLLMVAVVLLFASSSAAVAADYDWMRNFNNRAQTDLSDFKVQLGTRFKIGDAQVNAVLSNVDSAADAFMLLRLGEMCGRPTDYVMDRYRAGKGQGWGALAQSLGIKPGSREFHALKRGSGFHDYDDYGKGKGKDKGKSKSKGKGGDKGKNRN